jgi:phosphotransferase system enzyme I (PtsP)
MVSSVEEFEALRRTLADAKVEVPALGAMIEVPSALFELDEIAAVTDFLCVGTNDLTQHLLAVDRTNARVTRYFDVCSPAMVRALARITEAAKRAQKPLSICGEGASDPLLLPLWLGLGVDRLAVHATRIGILRALEARLDADDARKVVAELVTLTSARAIRARLEELAVPEVQALSRAHRSAE